MAVGRTPWLRLYRVRVRPRAANAHHNRPRGQRLMHGEFHGKKEKIYNCVFHGVYRASMDEEGVS